jgi:hypothetical protein
MKDIVIGAITKYDDFKYISCWVNSLDRSGFTGTKILLCYNIPYHIAEELTKRNYTVFAFGKNDEEKRLEYSKQNFNICEERFLHIWYFLNKLQNKEEYRYVIATDVGDLIFQSNPSEWLEKNLGDKQLNVGSECIHYKDEEWNKRNMYSCFGPMIYESMQDKMIYNAGAIAGKFDSFIDFCKSVYLTCGASTTHYFGDGTPDQSALNILLNTKPITDITNFAKSSDAWVANLHVHSPSYDKNLLTEPSPQMIGDKICTKDGVPYTIVHQYDMAPEEWQKIIQKKYGE